jgi:hypothetical protein
MKAGLRLYRAASNPDQSDRRNIATAYAAISPLFRDPLQVKQMLATDIAFYMGWVEHYVADAAQPLHNSIHHDGWSGADPRGYTRDPQIHGRFEWQYVDLIAVTEEDALKYMRKVPRLLEDVSKAVLTSLSAFSMRGSLWGRNKSRASGRRRTRFSPHGSQATCRRPMQGPVRLRCAEQPSSSG